jgi:hypothetical protein
MSAGIGRRVMVGIAVAAIVGACGGSASAAPSGPASQAAAPSSAAPSEASSVAASVAPSAGASLPTPSFQLPSDAKDLEAVLPASMCGTRATKLSQTGDKFVSSGNNEEFVKVLQSLGKSPSDVAYALAIAGNTGCAAGIFRIKGVDTQAFESAFAAQAQQDGDTFTDANLGGKQVKVQTNGSAKTYLYFQGDALIFAIATKDADAATVLQQLP